MKKEQFEKILFSLQYVLIPKIIEMQITGFYPLPFVYNKEEEYTFTINKTEMCFRIPYRRHREPTEPKILILENLKEWVVPEYRGEKALIELPNFVSSFAKSMIDYIKDGEIYQKEIKKILLFCEDISNNTSRIVILEKIIKNE